jgi:hypothetical protein
MWLVENNSAEAENIFLDKIITEAIATVVDLLCETAIGIVKQTSSKISSSLKTYGEE